ncbi:MAG: dTDP-4-dehydrorhamnose reductase [Zymomonas mobilis]|uniref:dTDP-4-dehydrorhamnose reductase n=1 Tax=Zymomonas mobilis TaxID=542 RepID=UPI0039EC5A29
MVKNRNDIILVIGVNGQLATSLSKFKKNNIVFVGRPKFDFNRLESISECIDEYQPNLVINTAAWTAVDLAESNRDSARQANYFGPKELARVCKKIDIPLIHISTDYVYAGDKGNPYIETDPIKPETVYGKTKAEGEQAVLEENPNSVILRTSWVYASHGKNFVRTIINAAKEKSQIKVVGDQYGNPTSADDLAKAILIISEGLLNNKWPQYQGIYHASGTGDTNWYDFSRTILFESQKYGIVIPEITPIKTLDWPTAAKRPQDSRLNCDKLKKIFGITLPDWQESISKTVFNIFQNNPY